MQSRLASTARQVFNQAGRIKRRIDARRERRYRREATAGRPLLQSELKQTLLTLGINAGDAVMVHAHTAILSQIEGGFMAPVKVLQEHLGGAGTLLMPTFPYRGSFWEYTKADPLFDVTRTPSQMGLLSEFFRRMPGVRRSLHPTHPVAVWGRHAEDWIRDHPEHPVPFHGRSPFGYLHQARGKVLFMDLDGWHLTQLHVVEGLLLENFPAPIYLQYARPMRVIDRERHERRVPVMIHDPRQASRIDVRYFYPELEKRGIVRRYKMRGYIPFVVVDAAAMAEYFVALAERGVTYCDRTSLTGKLRGAVSTLSTDAPKAALLTAD